jgi:hypothetical protein
VALAVAGRRSGAGAGRGAGASCERQAEYGRGEGWKARRWYCGAVNHYRGAWRGHVVPPWRWRLQGAGVCWCSWLSLLEAPMRLFDARKGPLRRASRFCAELPGASIHIQGESCGGLRWLWACAGRGVAQHLPIGQAEALPIISSQGR